MKIKIVSCFDSLMWYSNHIGEVFDVYREERDIYWTREPNIYRALNWVWKTDCVILEKETND